METQAFARLARSIARSLSEFADELDTAGNPSPARITTFVEMPEPRGSRQRDILALRGLATEEGMKTADIAADSGYSDVPNTYNTLQALQRGGIVELVAGASPQRWRLTAAYRNTAAILMRIGSLVRPGEVTSYGDVSQVAFGHRRGGQAVGQAALRIKDFPSAHRIVQQDGSIAPHWTRHDGTGGPDDCRGLLEAEGIEFDSEGRVLPRFMLSADELGQRYEDDLGGSVA